MTLVEASEVVRNIALIVSAPFAAKVALDGLSTWKREREWDRNHDLAGKLLLALRKRLDAFRLLRNPHFSAGEMRAAMGRDIEMSEIDQASEAAVNVRLKELSEAQREFYALQIEAEVIWNNTFPQNADKLRQKEIEVIFAIQEVAAERSDNSARELAIQQREARLKYRKVAFAEADDETEQNYLEDVKMIEDYLRQKLGR